MNRSLSLVLPVGNFDDDLIAPIIEWMQNKLKKKSDTTEHHNHQIKPIKIQDRRFSTYSNIKSNIMITPKKATNSLAGATTSEEQTKEECCEEENQDHDPFQRTGYPFGCLLNEIKYRYSGYVTDLKDAFNLHCLIAFVFTFTVCISPALSFGGILADKTDKWFGVNEMLLATSINGVIAGLFSGQVFLFN
jgi:hypothetical protein